MAVGREKKFRIKRFRDGELSPGFRSFVLKSINRLRNCKQQNVFITPRFISSSSEHQSDSREGGGRSKRSDPRRQVEGQRS